MIVRDEEVYTTDVLAGDEKPGFQEKTWFRREVSPILWTTDRQK